MQTLILPSGPVIRYYTDIDEFPAERRSWFTRYQIEAAEIDLTPQALVDRIGPILLANRDGRTEDVAIYLQNLYLSLQAATEQYAPDELSLGVLIHDVDGVPITDLSPEGLRAVLTPLQIPAHLVEQITTDVKKNSATAETATGLGLAAM